VWEGPRPLRTGAGLLMADRPPSLVALPDTRLELAVATPTGVYHGRMRLGSWSDAFRIDGLDAQSVALACMPRADPPAALELFATAADGTIKHMRFRDGRWLAPVALDGMLAVGAPSPAAR
jgi:hypothetical protein